MTKNALSYLTFLVPWHSGYAEQLQNSLPEFIPFFAIRLIMGLPHNGQEGESACRFSSVR